MNPELHRPVTLDKIGSAGVDITIEAMPAECAALAGRMRLPSIQTMSCDFKLVRRGSGVITARGRLHARVTQTCVVSLEDFEALVEEVFQITFVPAGTEKDVFVPEEDDELAYHGNVIDLGEAAAEQLGLALDPFPRMPGAALPTSDQEDEPKPMAGLNLRLLH